MASVKQATCHPERNIARLHYSGSTVIAEAQAKAKELGLCNSCYLRLPEVISHYKAVKKANQQERLRAHAEAEGRVYEPGRKGRPKFYGPARPPKEKQTKYCSICSKPMPSGTKRSTCSNDCWQSSVPKPTSIRKAKRNAYKLKHTYRHPNKSVIVDRLFALQRGACAACGRPGELVLDHDHVLKLPRALLCRRCNIALGQLDEDPNKLDALSKYAKACQEFRQKNQPDIRRP